MYFNNYNESQKFISYFSSKFLSKRKSSHEDDNVQSNDTKKKVNWTIIYR